KVESPYGDRGFKSLRLRQTKRPADLPRSAGLLFASSNGPSYGSAGTRRRLRRSVAMVRPRPATARMTATHAGESRPNPAAITVPPIQAPPALAMLSAECDIEAASDGASGEESMRRT